MIPPSLVLAVEIHELHPRSIRLPCALISSKSIIDSISGIKSPSLPNKVITGYPHTWMYHFGPDPSLTQEAGNIRMAAE